MTLPPQHPPAHLKHHLVYYESMDYWRCVYCAEWIGSTAIQLVTSVPLWMLTPCPARGPLIP